MARIGFFHRLFAVALDAIFGFFLSAGAAVVVIILLGNSNPAISTIIQSQASPASIQLAWQSSAILLFLFPAALIAIYFFLELKFAATPGKMIFGFVIRRQDGKPASIIQLACRWAAKYPPLYLALFGLFAANGSVGLSELAFLAAEVSIVFVGIAALPALFSGRQTFYDAAFGTAVYAEEQTAPALRRKAKGNTATVRIKEKGPEAKRAVDQLIFK